MSRFEDAVQRDLERAPDAPPVAAIEHRARRRRAREVAAGSGVAIVVGALVVALLVANGSNAPVSVRTLTTPPPVATTATTTTTTAPARSLLPLATEATVPSLNHILSIVQSYASGDGPVDSGEVVATTTDKTFVLFGGEAGSRPIYLVRLRGHFVCNACSVPAGAKAPSGDEIMFTVARHAPPPLDSAFSVGKHRDLDLSVFGRVYRLPPAIATARMVLPARTLRVDDAMDAQIVVENDTGSPLTFMGCGPLYQVVLENDATGKPEIAWETCLSRLTVPVGVTRYVIPLQERHLPAGEYRAVAFAQDTVIPTPSSVSVTVTP